VVSFHSARSQGIVNGCTYVVAKEAASKTWPLGRSSARHLVRHVMSASRQAVALALPPGPGKEGEEGWHSGLSTASDASSGTTARSISTRRLIASPATAL
jgi:hypothetical protein